MRVFACKNTKKKYFSLKMYALALRHCGDFSKINMHRSAFSYKKSIISVLLKSFQKYIANLVLKKRSQ